MGITNEVNAEALRRLRTHFGHREYRQGQEQIVEAVLGGHDVLAVMPTGSGKSLSYQLPAIVLPGTTLVVSPLISLMKDQVDELNRRGIPSGALHSMLPADGRRNVLNAARAGRVAAPLCGARTVCVGPVPAARSATCRSRGSSSTRRTACRSGVTISARITGVWLMPPRGAAAATARRRRPPMAAFTATATPEVRDDIVALLGLEQPQVLVAGFDRPNIYLRVERVEGEEEKDARLPHLVRGRRALVYAATRKSAEAARAC